MSGLVKGKWVETMPAAEEIKDGTFVRMDSVFRDRISSDPGADFPAEAGRYHLWVAYGCPWASRTLAFRVLKGLEDVISFSPATSAFMSQGWMFAEGPDGPEPDGYPLWRLYATADPGHSGKATVPVLWDKKTRRIVNNESSEIIRILNTAFDHITGNRLDLYPEPLRAEIDRWNALIYPNVNNGVYRSGFATTQHAYEEAVTALFATLDTIDAHLGANRYLTGEHLTEADWRLFTTLVRFDIAYYGAFNCNLRRIADYPNLSGYLRELYQWPGIASTVKLDEIKRGYYSLKNVTLHGIVPVGPQVDLNAPHGRDHLPGRGIWRREI
ncbi:MAG: glutathione S-transferase family protein [Sphingobium sp.]|nr:glutathione S-transferase family protein [Sphingobium sp.]